MKRILISLICSVELAATAHAQAGGRGVRPGELLEYSGTYKLLMPISVGHIATLSTSTDTIEGTAYWKFSLTTTISVPLFHLQSLLVSWTRISDFVSHRFLHTVDQTGWSRHDDFQIAPDSGHYVNLRDHEAHATVDQPLDDLALLYFLRLPTTELTVGTTYRYDRYFQKDKNPVVVQVIARERCDLPSKTTTECLVLSIVVNDPPHGMFMADQHARLWITDDALRLPVQIKSGPTTLHLVRVAVGS